MQKKFDNIKSIRGIVIMVLIGIVFLSFIFGNYNFSKDYQEMSKMSKISYIDLRMRSLFSDLNSFPRNSVNDISYLAKVSYVKNLFRSSGFGEKDLLEFMNQNSAYTEIILLDLEGNEILKIENLKDKNEINSEEDTYLDKSFLKKIKNLKQEEVIISDIISENDKSILNYATSVFNETGKIGYLIIKVDANYFLDNIRYAQRDGEEVFLVRADGEYIANADTEKEFAIDKNISIYSDYPVLTEINLLNPEKTFIESEEYLFSFKQLTLSEGYFTEYSENDEHLWILVFVTDKHYLNDSKSNGFFTYNIPCFIILFLLIVLYFIFERRKRWEN